MFKLVGRLFFFLAAIGCQSKDGDTLFKLRPDSGIKFTNAISENDSMNLMELEYFYRGGGVAIGDLNADQLPDIILGGNQVPTRLYLNRGSQGSAPFVFEDITEKAGFYTDRWVNGISLVDINQDGLMDVYLSVGGSNQPERRENLFFIQQDSDDQNYPLFIDRAPEFGLNTNKSTTQAVFFDYDRDNDLDVLLINTDPDDHNPNVVRDKSEDGSAPNADLLFENRLNEGAGFTDVSSEAGIVYEGFSLGVAVSDFNLDGWPDVYIANDHLTNDVLYINQQNKTFSNLTAQTIKNQSYFSMGVFVKDLDNNGKNDIFTLDMLPENNDRRKNIAMAMNLTRFLLAKDYGYQEQFMKNALHINLGADSSEKPIFTEVAQLAGIHDTDWSWGSVLADFDLDGDNDIVVANGYARNITDMDFIAYQENQNFFAGSLNTPEYRAAITQRPAIQLSNYAFRNEGNLQFSDVTKQWGLSGENLSNGVAYGDLDLDGDLDLVINHINQPASIYENTSQSDSSHYLKVYASTPAGIPVLGTKAYLYANESVQYQELYPVQGYQSTQEAVFHFGLNKQEIIDSLRLIWPDGSSTLYEDLRGDTSYIFHQSDAFQRSTQPATPNTKVWTQTTAYDWQHQPADPYGDIYNQPLLYQTFSKEGPLLVPDDETQPNNIFVGSGPNQPMTILSLQQDGQWVMKYFEKQEQYEDTDAAWLDADQNGDLDLFVASGNVSFRDGHPSLQDRLYLQSAAGFELALDRLPDMKTFTKEVVKVDFDQDGDEDLLVFGRMVNGRFPASPQSHLLRNDRGTFTDVSEQYLPEGGKLGMVSCAEVADLDQDGRFEVIYTGEWQGINVLKWQAEKYVKTKEYPEIDSLQGWWQSLHIADLNQDNYPDILAGNVGLNHPYADHLPLVLVATDLDGDQQEDPLLGWHIVNSQGDKKLYPALQRDDLLRQFPALRNTYRTYHDFADLEMHELLLLSRTPPWQQEANYMQSVVLLNQKGKEFAVKPLPRVAQTGPINAFVTRDFNSDGAVDILGLGNNRKLSVSMGWNDNFTGVVLLNQDTAFVPLPWKETQLHVLQEVRDAVPLGNGEILISSYADSLQVLHWKPVQNSAILQ